MIYVIKCINKFAEIFLNYFTQRIAKDKALCTKILTKVPAM